jgi:hypothetical protein
MQKGHTMAKRQQRTSVDKAEQLVSNMTFRISPELRERLVAAAAGDRPIGEEIRRRLEASFAVPAIDPKTAELVGAIVHIADGVQRDYAPWHKDRFAFEALKHAFAKVLRIFEPQGEPVVKFNPTGLARLIYYGADDPEVASGSQAAVTPEIAGDTYAGQALNQIISGRQS